MALCRAVLASAALLLLLCLSPAPAAAENTVPAWNNCGGSQFCPCGVHNCDQQWPGHTCQPSEACVRKDQTWWRCEPRQNGEAAAGLHAMEGLCLQGGTVLRPSLRALRQQTQAPDEALVLAAACPATTLSCVLLLTQHTTQCAPRPWTHGQRVVVAARTRPGTRPAASTAMCAVARTPAGGGVSLQDTTMTATVRCQRTTQPDPDKQHCKTISHLLILPCGVLFCCCSLLGLCGHLAALLLSQQGVLLGSWRHLCVQGRQVVAL